MDEYLKAVRISDHEYRLLAIPFGGPFNGKDLQGQFFSERTDVKPHWFGTRPIVYQHGKDPSMKATDVGEQVLEDSFTPGEGWWSRIQLDNSAKYWKAINDLIEKGKLYGSSGALGHFVRTNQKSGEIMVWPHAEQTLSVMPINFFSRITTTKAVPDLEAMMSDLRLDLPEDGDLLKSGDLFNGGEEAARERLATAVKRLELRLAASR
jgi:hypothetical protein